MSSVYAKNLITPEEVKSQLKQHLLIKLEDRHSEFYVKTTHKNELFQGDIFRVRKSTKRKLKTDLVLLVSNTCDMQPDREKNILVIPLKQLPDPSQVHPSQKSKMSSLFDNVTKYENTIYFFLPPVPETESTMGLPPLFGEFGDITPVSSNELNQILQVKPEDRILSLKESGFYILLIKLSVFFLRPDDRFSGIS